MCIRDRQYVCTKKSCSKRILCPDCILDHQSDVQHILSLECFIEQNTGFSVFHSEHDRILEAYKLKLNESTQTISAGLDKLVADLTAVVSTLKTKLIQDSATNLKCLEEALKLFSNSRERMLRRVPPSSLMVADVKTQPDLLIFVEELMKTSENDQGALKDLQLQHQMIQSRFVDRDLIKEAADHIKAFEDSVKKFLTDFPLEKEIVNQAYSKLAFSKQTAHERLQITENGTKVEYKKGGSEKHYDDRSDVDRDNIAYAFIDVDLSQPEKPLSWTIEIKRKLNKPKIQVGVGVAIERILLDWYKNNCYGLSLIHI
eukprot:TRINITY_DN20682_c0_g1_i1.p1 TRINITY_DN20682_c0_g1~~TRINITY_DN20682_c0_g1_i1.p1  ORF type:complete len:334 (-),score=64.03 TRINITY_DN20682_c0_g1_i1:59-1003(-)